MDKSIYEIWEQALGLLVNSYSEVIYRSWIEPLSPHSYIDGIFVLNVENEFFKEMANKRLPEIKRCLCSVLGIEVDVVLDSLEKSVNKPNERIAKKSVYPTNLKGKYVFENFVRGKSNELAYAASQAVAEEPGASNYNPLFLYGGVGLGKTHLLHSIGNYIIETNSDLKVCYVSTETFTNEFIYAIRQRETSQFKSKYREVDVLLLDDIQFLEGKMETQEELFHTFNALYNNNKQIALTSDQPPKDIKSLENRLSSRFAMGLTVDIALPDFETRIAILDKKLSMENLKIPDDVAIFIAKNIFSNIRDLEGALNKVTAYSRLTHTPITMELAEKALKDLISGAEKPEITIGYIQEVVASHYNLTVEDMISPKRTRNIVYPRQIAMYLTRKILSTSLPQLGAIFGGRNHSTVIHGCDKIIEDMESDPNLQKVLFDLENRIRNV